MRWKDKTYYPMELDAQYFKLFALWPVLLDGGNYVWLEWYWKKKRFTGYGYYADQIPPKIFGQSVNGPHWYNDNTKIGKTKESVTELLDNYYRNIKDLEIQTPVSDPT